MNTHNHEKVFSTERMQRYLQFHSSNEQRALIHYQANILLSETFYPLLSIFEVALRNSLNRELTKHFGTTEWYLKMGSVPGLKDLNREITIAKKHISKRGETITGSKVVAELTLGFWVRLLNAEYERILWKSLRMAFPFLIKKERQRHKVSVPLNKIRNFRNRVYHNEPIAWKFQALESIHLELMEVMGWINNELPQYAQGISRFNNVLASIRIQLP